MTNFYVATSLMQVYSYRNLTTSLATRIASPKLGKRVLMAVAPTMYCEVLRNQSTLIYGRSTNTNWSPNILIGDRYSVWLTALCKH